ncbi:hypothetical protein [Microbulbifer variabilis]|uniref:hypothetical protein n=1 Tax=Microbulbifer variabilis TaxID=266805 RepID=UPI001CFCF736|nr:hypothetical protein [Microbulbifer variabilis]
MRKLFLCLAALSLVGCANTDQYNVTEYAQAEQSLPSLSLFAKMPEEDFERRCNDYSESSLLKHCQYDVVDYTELFSELETSTVFQSVHFGNDDVPYQLLVSSAGYSEEGIEEIGEAVIAGATMMLAPVRTTRDIQVSAILTWHGLPLKRYQLEFPFTTTVSLFSSPASAKRDLAKVVAAQLISQLQNDRAMEPEYLYQSIGASDYHTALNLPESVGEYVSNPLVLASHPLFGAQTRYVHRQFQFDSVDVFVYPIPNWEWGDMQLAQVRELDRVRQELYLVEKEAQWQALDLNEEASEIWRVQGQDLPVTRLSGYFLAADGERFDTHTYLFVRQDKFIKVRASFSGEGRGREEVEAFARGLIAQANVPSESRFMANVRESWRERQAGN